MDVEPRKIPYLYMQGCTRRGCNERLSRLFFKKTQTKARENEKLAVLFLQIIKNDYLCVTINVYPVLGCR